VKCKPGTYRDTTQKAVGTNSPCLPCAYGKITKAGATLATECTTNQCTVAGQGYQDDTTATCATCKAGYIAVKSGHGCQKCKPGTYSNSARTACVPCPTATPLSLEGAQSQTECKAKCATTGYGLNMTDITRRVIVCAPCPMGSYKVETGSGCAVCPAGTYSAGGVNKCTLCPGEKISLAGAIKSTDCFAQCGTAGQGLKGYYKDFPEHPVCDACPLGYQKSTSAPGCTICPAGTYYLSGSCKLCAATNSAKPLSLAEQLKSVIAKLLVLLQDKEGTQPIYVRTVLKEK